MKSNCVLRINREGVFTVHYISDPRSQCGSIGQQRYKYFVSIEASNRWLTKEGYLMENGLVGEYFDRVYTGEKRSCVSCEVMAQRAVDTFRRMVMQENPRCDLRRILVRLHGSPFSFIEAEWKAV
jgi:hypothetical protein